ncbi:MAG: ABC transporter ATP-binding protein [Acidimicrobiales bacterium]
MNVLDVDHLAVDLPVEGQPRRVIHDVTLSIAEGEAVGLVGESGAGKSMASRAVIRLLPHGATVLGDVSFEGRSVLAMDRTQLRAFRAHDVAMVFQDPRAHINPVRTVGDFLVEALVERGDARGDAVDVVSGLLRVVGIDDPARRMRQYPHELSGGLLQRVMIAAALAVSPKLLLADEPTTALDVTTQSDVMVNLDTQRRERGLAMLFVTHDLELAAAVCDRIAVLYAGFLVEDVAAADLHRAARHPYTAGLLASRPSPTTRERRLVAIPGRPLSAYEVGPGCAFATRCAFAVERCHTERPELRDLDGGRVACHRAEELRRRLTLIPTHRAANG